MVVEPVAKKFVAVTRVVVAQVVKREVPVPSPTKIESVMGVDAPVPSFASRASIASLALECWPE